VVYADVSASAVSTHFHNMLEIMEIDENTLYDFP
jgi:hypothetical protein